MPALSQLSFLQALGWALLNSLWQMALLWIIFKLILSVIPHFKSGKKTILATFLIITGFGWFLFTFFTTLFYTAPGDLYNNWIGLLNESSQVFYMGKLLSIFTYIYLVLLIIPIWNFIRNYYYVQLIRYKGLTKISAEWKIFVRNTAENLGIIKNVQIWISDIVKSPVTIGFLKPVILIPVAAINQLTTQQVEAIILHELYHIHRHDYLINLVIKFIKTILYFNPFVNLFVKSIERERENSCDEMVIQFQYRPTEYATALLTLEKNNHPQMLIAASGKNRDLINRIESILGMVRKTRYSLRQFSISLATLLFIAFMNVFFFANKNPETFSHLAFNSELNPYYFLNSRSEKPVIKQPVLNNNNNNQPLSSTYAMNETDMDMDMEDFEIEEPYYNPAYRTVNFTQPVIPELDKKDELKLIETIGATKKILEVMEWKELEKSSAEVFNSYEKEKLKREYLNEVDKIDWDKFETKLRISYDNINWEKVNDQIALSMAQIKLDSIQQEINLTINKLANLEKWMKANKTTCIPDSDISLKHIKEYQQKANEQLEKIRINRTKKVVKL